MLSPYRESFVTNSSRLVVGDPYPIHVPLKTWKWVNVYRHHPLCFSETPSRIFCAGTMDRCGLNGKVKAHVSYTVALTIGAVEVGRISRELERMR
jgi:hypothetical protein